VRLVLAEAAARLPLAGAAAGLPSAGASAVPPPPGAHPMAIERQAQAATRASPRPRDLISCLPALGSWVPGRPEPAERQCTLRPEIRPDLVQVIGNPVVSLEQPDEVVIRDAPGE